MQQQKPTIEELITWFKGINGLGSKETLNKSHVEKHTKEKNLKLFRLI